MFNFWYILENKDVVIYLKKRWLVNQYKKSKQLLLSWMLWKTDFKQRKPKNSWVYSFRVNQQFRAFWKINSEWDLVIYEINNHQNY